MCILRAWLQKNMRFFSQNTHDSVRTWFRHRSFWPLGLGHFIYQRSTRGVNLLSKLIFLLLRCIFVWLFGMFWLLTVEHSKNCFAPASQIRFWISVMKTQWSTIVPTCSLVKGTGGMINKDSSGPIPYILSSNKLFTRVSDLTIPKGHQVVLRGSRLVKMDTAELPYLKMR